MKKTLNEYVTQGLKARAESLTDADAILTAISELTGEWNAAQAAQSPVKTGQTIAFTWVRDESRVIRSATRGPRLDGSRIVREQCLARVEGVKVIDGQVIADIRLLPTPERPATRCHTWALHLPGDGNTPFINTGSVYDIKEVRA